MCAALVTDDETKHRQCSSAVQVQSMVAEAREERGAIGAVERCRNRRVQPAARQSAHRCPAAHRSAGCPGTSACSVDRDSLCIRIVLLRVASSHTVTQHIENGTTRPNTSPSVASPGRLVECIATCVTCTMEVRPEHPPYIISLPSTNHFPTIPSTYPEPSPPHRWPR